jgi:hypothetical protein
MLPKIAVSSSHDCDKNMQQLPLIAVLTQTKNRGKTLAFQVQQMLEQDYPQELTTWIISDASDVNQDDNSWEPIKNMYPNVIYKRIDPSIVLGDSRNICIEAALNETDAQYMFIMDDDDIVHTSRFTKCVKALQNAPQYEVAGCSAVDIYNLKTHKYLKTNVYNLNHSTEPHLCFTRKYAETHRFESGNKLGQGKSFLENWKLPILQMPATDVTLVIGHENNIFNKYQIEQNPGTFKIQTIKTVSIPELKERWNISDKVLELFLKAYNTDINAPCDFESEEYMCWEYAYEQIKKEGAIKAEKEKMSAIRETEVRKRKKIADRQMYRRRTPK